MKFHAVKDFKPGVGTGWFKFPNSFNLNLTDFSGTVTWKGIPIGHASYGLCGGMVYAVRDYYELNQNSNIIPQCEQLILSSELGSFIKKRQVDSLMNKTDLLTYIYQTTWANINSDREMIKTAWPQIKEVIDSDHPATVGLILSKSLNPLSVMKNHQILAYSYAILNNEVYGEKARIQFYDPSIPNYTDLYMEFNLKDGAKNSIETNRPDSTIYAFFKTEYSAEKPPLLGAVEDTDV